MKPWTEEIIEKMLTNMRAGYSARQNAEMLGPDFTKGMVIGKAHKVWGYYGPDRVKEKPMTWRFRSIPTPEWPGHEALKEPFHCRANKCRRTKQPGKLYCDTHTPLPPRTRAGTALVTAERGI